MKLTRVGGEQGPDARQDGWTELRAWRSSQRGCEPLCVRLPGVRRGLAPTIKILRKVFCQRDGASMSTFGGGYGLVDVAASAQALITVDVVGEWMTRAEEKGRMMCDVRSSPARHSPNPSLDVMLFCWRGRS